MFIQSQLNRNIYYLSDESYYPYGNFKSDLYNCSTCFTNVFREILCFSVARTILCVPYRYITKHSLQQLNAVANEIANTSSIDYLTISNFQLSSVPNFISTNWISIKSNSNSTLLTFDIQGQFIYFKVDLNHIYKINCIIFSGTVDSLATGMLGYIMYLFSKLNYKTTPNGFIGSNNNLAQDIYRCVRTPSELLNIIKKRIGDY